jgi:CheY-like chemotaxis protein
LVVDDSKSARFALRKYLEGHDYQVEAVESAAEALRYLQEHRPEVIFLDHIMPGTDGFEALRALKSDPGTVSIPVVICSSNEGADFNAQARARGAAGVLQKPPSPQQLAEILAGLRELSSSLRLETAPRRSDASAAEPSKVTNIREPDVAIEQVVMKALRQALPPQTPASPSQPAAASAPAMPIEDNAVLRELYESRMRKITQDLYTQLGEIKAGVALLDAERRNPADDQRAMQAIAADAIADVGERLQALDHRIGRIEQDLHAQFEELRNELDAALQLQSQRLAERIDQALQNARAVAADEAHAVAERTVMSAASRISDRLADSILKALGRSS